MDPNFKQIFDVGNVVKCKSGGPDMTVECYSKKSVKCIWFNGNEIRKDSFEQDTLVLVPGANSVNKEKVPAKVSKEEKK